MAILPAELILEILLLLPIAALLRFRCVSKAWRNLIDSPGFVKAHFDRPGKERPMVILLGRPNVYQFQLHAISNPSDAPRPFLKELTPNPCLGTSGHDNPLDNILGNLGIAGPCNSLLCIKMHAGFFCLWNPSTRKHFHVPQMPLQEPNEFFMSSWGFGYDSDSDDYKVVCIRRITFGHFVVWVYSLTSGAWSSIGDFPYVFAGAGEKGLFFGGKLHWVVNDDSNIIVAKMIVAFDLKNLEFHPMAQPESMQHPVVQYRKEMRLRVLGGHFYAMYEHRDGTNAFDLWVMREYGVKESWARLIAFQFSTPAMMEPLAYTEAGDLVLWRTDFSDAGVSKFIMRYEFQTKSFIRMDESLNEQLNPLLPSLDSPFVYVPSLVYPQIGGDPHVAP